MAARIASRTLGTGSNCPLRRTSAATLNLASLCATAGTTSSDLPKANSSRGLTEPKVVLASRRSRSSTWASDSRKPARVMVSRAKASTASSRSVISSSRMAGCSRRRRSKRPPMPVRVSSSTATKVDSRLSPTNIGSSSSRLRTVTLSKIIESLRSNQTGRSKCSRAARWVSRR